MEAKKNQETVTSKKNEISNEAPAQTSSVYNQPQFQQPQEDFFNSTPDLPSNYNKNKLVFMIRDPHWAFAYWELNEALINEHDLNNKTRIIRVYDITNTRTVETADSYYDINLTDNADNWYINLNQPNRTFILELGYLYNGIFIPLVRSNPGTTPRDDISDQIDQEWMLNDEQFSTILNASGANQLFMQIGSQELMKFIAGNISEESSISSGNISSPLGSSFLK